MSNPFLLYDRHQLADDVAIHRKLHDKSAAHHGLHFEKFFGRWGPAESQDHPAGYELVKNIQDGNRRLTTDPVLDWLDPRPDPGKRTKGGRTIRQVGDTHALNAAINRARELAAAQMRARFGEEFNQLDPAFPLVLVSRLMTGLGLPHPCENGFLFHPTLGVPYLRGTALKQVAYDWADEGYDWGQWWKRDTEDRRSALKRLFGSLDGEGYQGAGCLAFLDALPTGPATLTAEQITSHYGPYYGRAEPALGRTLADHDQPADWHDPTPVTLLAVDGSFDAPLQFQFAVLPLRRAQPQDVAAARDWLIKGLETNGVGAKTTLGFGRFLTEPKLSELKATRRRRPEIKERSDSRPSRSPGTRLTVEEQERRHQALLRARANSADD